MCGPAWQGRGGASFETVSLAWAEDQRRLLRALGDTANSMRAAARTYTATDEAAGQPDAGQPDSLPL